MVHDARRLLGLGLGLVSLPASAVLFMSTGAPEHNTQPPTGELADSGWQWQGEWYGFLGTAIAPDCFITARHVGGNIGDVFIYRGVWYHTVESYEDAASDLRIWRICGRFPDYAPIYEGNQEAGSPLVVFGRGTQRGEPVYAPDNPTELRGWRYGPVDQRWRWGTNVVTAIVKLGSEVWANDFLAADFDRDGGGEEAQLSGGDSGGSVFIRDAGQWKLAGINHAVDGSFNTSTNGAGFGAALFDARGFYVGSSPYWEPVEPGPKPVASAFYAARISTKAEWIRSVLAKPSPLEAVPTVWSAESPAGPFTEVTGASVDIAAREIRLPLPAGTRFFKLTGSCPRPVVSVTKDGDALRLKYE